MTDAIIYSSVSQGERVLAEFTAKSGNFLNVVQRILKNLPPHDNEVTYQYGEYYFALVVKSQIVYLAMADKSISDIEAAHRFLKDISTKFQQRYGESGQRCDTNTSVEFKNVLQDSMDYFSSSDARQRQTAQIQAEMDRTKDVMHETIGQALARGENLDKLVQKTDDLSRQSVNFKRQAREIKRSYWAKNVKVMLLCVFIVVVIIYFIVAEGFGCGLTFKSCGGHSGR